MSHPFGELLRQYRSRKPGLSQVRLAHMMGYNHAVLARMSQGQKDLTGPSGRDRVVRIIEALRNEGVSLTVAEANALLAAADQPPLYEGLPVERALLKQMTETGVSELLHAAPLGIHPVTPLYYRPPAPFTSLIGREREVAEIVQLFGMARLVTLSGAGGSGKTRLAVEVAACLAERYANGSCFVSLTSVSRTDGVVPAIVQALGVHVDTAQTLLDNLKHFLASKALLLVLDNYEHVLDAATVVPELLMAAPGLAVLATSREALRVSGEYAYPVDPLPVPASKEHPSAEQLAKCAAVQLFVERARAAQSRFHLSDTNVASVAEICRRVDGLPLAIESAAARIRQFTPQLLLDKMGGVDSRGLAVLVDGPRDLPVRQRTLRATIEWSYRLLNGDQQRLLRYLGMFTGGAEPEQIAVVGDRRLELGDSPMNSVAEQSLISSLQSLVDKNLVRAETLHDGTTRYSLLELVREYALERLHEHGEYEIALRRYAEAFAALAEQSVGLIHGHAQLYWRNRLQRDYANLREALAWSFSPTGDELVGCRLVGTLSGFWAMATMYIPDMQRWIRMALSVTSDRVSPKLRGDVIYCAIENDLPTTWEGWIELGQQALAFYSVASDQRGIALAKFNIAKGLLGLDPHSQEGVQFANESMALGHEIGDAFCASLGMVCLAFRAQWLGDDETAERLLRQMVAARRTTGDHVVLAIGLWQLAGLLTARLRFQEALEYAKEAAVLSQRIGNPLDEVLAREIIGENICYLGDAPGAVRLLEDCLSLAREHLPESHTVGPLVKLAKAVNKTGDIPRAGALLAEAVRIGRVMKWPDQHYRGILDALAAVDSASDDATRSARLWGVADVVWESNPAPRPQNNVREFASYRARVREQLGDVAFEAAYAEGRSIPVQLAIDSALSDSTCQRE